MANWIRAAQARAEQATEGPWATSPTSHRDLLLVRGGGDYRKHNQSSLQVNPPEDATFIAAARSDVPRLCTALLEAVEALEIARGRMADPTDIDWPDAADEITAVLTRIQADPEVEHG